MIKNIFVLFPDFKNLFISRIISAIGDKFFSLSLIWWVIENNNSKMALSLVMAATFLPSVIFSPIMGTFADRYNKKHLMLIADITRALLLLLLFIFISIRTPDFKIILLIVFLIYSIAPLFETSTASSLVLLTDNEHLNSATAIDSSSIAISNVIGAALGSIFISTSGFKGSILLNSLTYLLSFFFVSQIKKNLLSKTQTTTNYISDLKEGIRYIFNQKKDISFLLIFFGILNLFVSPILLIIPLIVKYVVNENVKWLAIMETFFAGGSVLGSFIMSYKKTDKRNIKILILSIFFFSILFSLTSISKNPFITTTILFFIAVSISIGNVSIISYFQKEINDEYKGRFFSIINTIVYAIIPLSFVINGFLIDMLKVEKVIILNSICALVMSIYAGKRFSRRSDSNR